MSNSLVLLSLSWPTTLSQHFPYLPDNVRIVKVTRTVDPMKLVMVADCYRNSVLFKMQDTRMCQERNVAQIFLQDSAHPNRSSSIRNNSWCLLTFAILYYKPTASRMLNIRKADFTGAACGMPFLLLFPPLSPPARPSSCFPVFFPLTQSRTLAHAG